MLLPPVVVCRGVFLCPDALHVPTIPANTYTGARAGSEYIEAPRPTDKRKAIQRLVEAAGDMSSRAIADAVGCCNHTVDCIRGELGNLPPEKRKGKDGKQYPATMKREPRGEKDK